MKLQTPTKTLKVREFNEFLSCHICGGYLINPTTVDNCLHTYCRSCIVQHLHQDTYCPLCKAAGGGKQINVSNLKSDDVLRALIFKLVPGLYQKEHERALQYKVAQRRNGQQSSEVEEDAEEVCNEREQETVDEHFFEPAEPISLSLEYHPALLKGYSTSQIPPVRYLQCPACLKIRHLKRFLCSKFDIDPESKRIEVEVIYEDEVLPNDFTLMDVGYCYNWKRHAPMKFTYRILFYADDSRKLENDGNKSDVECRRNSSVDTVKAAEIHHDKDIRLCDDETNITTLSNTSNSNSPPSVGYNAHAESLKPIKNRSKMAKPSKVNSNKTQAKLPAEEMNAPVKMIIARKSSADSGKKPSPKRNNHDEVTYTVTNDFKSLRSNDMRYSDYAVSSTTSNSNSPKNSPKSAQRSPKTSTDVAIIVESTPPPATTTAQMATTVSKCDILVSIPQSQMPKSPYSVDDEFENVSLAQLKTASKKSPPSAASTTVSNASESAKSVAKNVPKLKIELNSLKSRLSISKPKSAGVLQSTDISEKRGRTKQRKHSLDDVAAPLTDRLDLETYAKNIGLLPIEVLTPPESADLCDKLKYSPNASPLSSASSTTSSSNNAFPLVATTELATTTTFHKKRKKKHSKDSKEPKDSKRRRMHAEISSRPEEESLKMKVKLTTPHNHKSHKSESSTAKKNNDESRKSHTSVSNAKSQPSSAAASVQQATSVNDNILALNRTLGEESRSINHLMMEKERTKEVIKVVKADETLLTLSHTHLLPKPYNNIKEVKLPASPPLPPSLFKTTPLNFNTLTVTSTTTGQSKPTNTSASKQTDLPKAKQPVATASKPTSAPQYNRQSSLNLPKPHAQFIVPNLPRRPSPGSKSAYTPSSIASASSKQLGMQLKRSASLDESYALSGRGKQPKLDAAQRKTLYSSYTNKPFVATSNSCVLSKFNDCVTNAQSVNSNGNNNSAVTITARPPGGMAQAQTRWQLPPYTPLQLPFHKPAVEIVRINSNQTAADLQAQAAGNASKSGRMMGPPLSMVRGKKTGGQQLCADALKSQPMAMSATTLGLGRGNPYRLSPPALVNLQAPTFPNAKKAGSLSIADNAARKAESLSTLNGGASDKQSQQSRISLREFRPMREHTIDLVNDGGEKSTVGQAADTTAATASATPSARECLEAALNKIKQNITSTTVQDTVTAVAAAAAAAAAKQQQLAKPTQMNNEDLQNLHLLSESATTREKIAIRSIQSYEKPLLQQSSLVRQQNASVRNIPNPSALAFRNMSTLPAVSSTMVSASATATNLTNTNSSTTLAAVPTTSSSTSPPTQKTLPLVALPLHSTTTTATTPSPLSPGNLLQASATASNSALNATTNTITTSTRTMKKPTTIDQVAANLNMRASAAAAAEAHASKLNAVEDTSTQISSSTSSSAAAVGSQNNTNDCAKTTSPSSSAAITSSEPSASAVAAAAATGAVAVAVAVAERAKEEQANSKATNGADESVKAKVLPKSIGDDVVGVTTAIVTDVTSIKNLSTNNNNNNNNSKNNNNNSSNSNSSSTNVKYGVTTASVASD